MAILPGGRMLINYGLVLSNQGTGAFNLNAAANRHAFSFVMSASKTLDSVRIFSPPMPSGLVTSDKYRMI